MKNIMKDILTPKHLFFIRSPVQARLSFRLPLESADQKLTSDLIVSVEV